MAPRRAAVLRGEDDGRSLREHLIATAEHLIADRGTAGLTVRAIAREAGVADGVLYNHFADKEELLANALYRYVRSVERGLGPLPEPGVGTVEAGLRVHLAYGLALHRAILPAFTGLLAQPVVLARFAELRDHGEHWRDKLLGYLRAERESGRLAADAQVDAAAAMLVGVCHETVLSALLPSGTASGAPAVESVVTAVLNGIS
ncbi:AcrR family transcriptional regulator [Actinoalloteichus hoggarensis]|uniref:HTH-type transcriptional repressor KstR2 n=1 Tax=Actinoalloteichus hoggarensis TaxID=1470176 RepID=A0A221WCC6_9PSEU|nr:TetR/AcrR family transcriptional regulator [Actinoalloteichus hoggarensis]ASO23139.1 HTH-type transcriptional repressor KstR2 [Actinoalloteichus hoggarensis]MBB5922743.1 AcrR family transcriptional regulator [Actinoalloteichus hoggarensis]